MKPLPVPMKTVIAIAASISTLYVSSIVAGLRPSLIFTFLGLSLGATCWMVMSILKDPFTPTKTFEDYFYEDREDLRRNGREEA